MKSKCKISQYFLEDSKARSIDLVFPILYLKAISFCANDQHSSYCWITMGSFSFTQELFMFFSQNGETICLREYMFVRNHSIFRIPEFHFICDWIFGAWDEFFSRITNCWNLNKATVLCILNFQNLQSYDCIFLQPQIPRHFSVHRHMWTC